MFRLPVSQCFGYPRVLGTPVPKTLVFWVSLQYDFSVLGIPRSPPPVPRSLVFWTSLTHAYRAVTVLVYMTACVLNLLADIMVS